jgi:cell division protein FtsX
MKPAWVGDEIVHQIRGHRALAMAAVAAYLLLALVAGGTWLGARTVSRWGAFVGQNVHVIVYLADDGDAERGPALAQILERVPTVQHVALVEPSQALAQLVDKAASFGANPKSLAGLEPAYFPRSLEVTLAPAADLASRASDLAKRLRGVPGILQVDAMSNGLARLSVWVRLGRSVGLAALLAFGLGTLAALVAVFLRSRSVARVQAGVLAQLGETALGIRLPSSLWMMVSAIVGGGLGAVLLKLAWRPLLTRLEASLGLPATIPLPSLGAVELAAGLAVILLLGVGLGYFAVPMGGTKVDRA